MSAAATTSIATEYLMTLHAPIAGAPQRIDDTLTIFHSDSGRVEGPRINGTILPPTADWLRTMPGGSLRVDARMSLRTHDGADIYVQYGGVIAIAPADFARMAAGETLGAKEMYFVTAPVFQTADSRYAWLNTVQAIGKAVALKGGAGGYVRYEVFAIR
jgi:Protein of unknown function (DUF3237)